MKRPTTNTQQDCFPRKTWLYDSQQLGRRVKSSAQPSSNGSWFCPMRCLTLTPSFFLGSTGQGVQQASTGCSQMNPEMPFCDRDLQPASGKRCTSQVSAWNQVTNLALSTSYGNEPWKDKKRHKFRSLLMGYHGHEGSTDPSRNLDEMTHCGKDGYQACTNCSGACYFAWGVPWFGGLSFVSRLWFEEGLTNTPFKMPFSNYDP